MAEISTYCLITYGCQMNDADSEAIAGDLAARGWRRVHSESDADLVLVNTCVVRRSAEQRALGRIWQLAALKKKRPAMVIGVVPWMGQKEKDALLERLPHVDLVVGPRDLPRLGEMVREIMLARNTLAWRSHCSGAFPLPKTDGSNGRRVAVDGIHHPVHFAAEPQRDHPLKARVTIMHGCNNGCSYCIVPLTRGREWSRPADEILAEVEKLAAGTWREVLLLGQNVNSYHDGRHDFADLLRRVAAVPGILRVRYVTSHPKDLSDRLIEVVAATPAVCENFHLPAQAGSDRVLERMNRGYGREDYLRRVGQIRRAIPHATITTDLMVGFPGETDADFEDTLDLVRRVRWDSAFTFLYSPREGTRAAQWPDDVPAAVKRQRLQRLIELQEQISAEINQSLVGTRQELLVEGPSRRSDRLLMGRTRGDKVVIFEGPPDCVGQLIEVRITRAAPHTLFGERTRTYV
ncbi:MAG: tRNA (N6-isopentenyl adenosine(37)-C2)-methylthiotransferase MiaB [Candidatus Sumerlaeia bacterium]|nr:tRNA (N6-isopentenyl adenosine(37)-C2)-methylthiotransferase MiaB [Candidatus Sumerlaeia bacterium]